MRKSCPFQHIGISRLGLERPMEVPICRDTTRQGGGPEKHKSSGSLRGVMKWSWARCEREAGANAVTF